MSVDAFSRGETVATIVRRPRLAFSAFICFAILLLTFSGPVSQLVSSPAQQMTTTKSQDAHAALESVHAVAPSVRKVAANRHSEVPLVEPIKRASSASPKPAGVSDLKCHARLHTDYMGERAPVWGLGQPGFHLRDAAECCAACQAHAAVCGKPGSERQQWWPSRPDLRCGGQPGCNIWVFCPEKQCFAFDIHKHLKGE